MIKDTEAWQAWEREQVRNTPVDFEQNARILDAMYEQARAMGLFPLADPLEGLDAKIKFAKAINVPLDHRAMRDHP